MRIDWGGIAEAASRDGGATPTRWRDILDFVAHVTEVAPPEERDGAAPPTFSQLQEDDIEAEHRLVPLGAHLRTFAAVYAFSHTDDGDRYNMWLDAVRGGHVPDAERAGRQLCEAFDTVHKLQLVHERNVHLLCDPLSAYALGQLLLCIATAETVVRKRPVIAPGGGDGGVARSCATGAIVSVRLCAFYEIHTHDGSDVHAKMVCVEREPYAAIVDAFSVFCRMLNIFGAHINECMAAALADSAAAGALAARLAQHAGRDYHLVLDRVPRLRETAGTLQRTYALLLARLGEFLAPPPAH